MSDNITLPNQTLFKYQNEFFTKVKLITIPKENITPKDHYTKAITSPSPIHDPSTYFTKVK
jgi:hypothetical protein